MVSMGIIDTHSEHSLYDVLDGTMAIEDTEGMHSHAPSIDFYGFHITPRTKSGGSYSVVYDGHLGHLDTINSEDYDDILELVDDLMDYVFEAHHYDYQDDKEGLVEWAGKIITDDPEREREDPDLYVHVPEQPEGL